MRSLGEHALRLLIALCAFANKLGQCWPSLATISTSANVDRRRVPAALAKLEKMGLIVRSRIGAGKSTSYIIIYPEVSRLDVTAAGQLTLTGNELTAINSRRQRRKHGGNAAAAEHSGDAETVRL
jgi:hypothetical protein